MSMMFRDAAQAIKWAEEVSSRPDVGSQIGKIMRGLGGGGEPVFDVALSISARVAQCKPRVAAVVTKALYGPPSPETDIQVGWLIGEHVRAKVACARKRSPEQIHKLGTATLKAERAETIYGDRYPLRRMAHDCGVSHTQYRNGMDWLDMRRESTEVIRLWLDIVHKQIDSYLEAQGWLMDYGRDEA
jgi:hypothetical protein